MTQPTPSLPFLPPCCLGLLGNTSSMKSCEGIPRSCKHLREMPCSQTPAVPHGESLRPPSVMLPSVTSGKRRPPHIVDFEAQSLQLSLTAFLSCYLRLTHIVTSMSPRLAPGCAEALPRVDFHHRCLHASWRTLTSTQFIESKKEFISFSL